MKTRVLKKKIFLISYALALAFFLIGARLTYLQIHSMRRFIQRGEKNFLRREAILSPRGNILDTHGKLIATNRPVTNVYWHGSGKRKLTDAMHETLNALAALTHVPLDEELLRKLTINERRYKKTLLAKDVPFDDVSKIEERFPAHPNLQLNTSFERFYPYGTHASHVLGYLGRMHLETTGKMGLEHLFEDTLRGEQGTLLKKINSLGKNLNETTIKESLTGNNIQTTIDINIQALAESSFPDQESGTFIVMNPDTGAILALVSRPDFDPAMFLKPISQEQWREAQEQRPFLNRALSACYPPGSIFKLVTISAALENGLVTQDQHWQCDGYLHFAKRKYWCHRRYGHGELTTGQGLAQSCNIMFYEIGKKIDIDTLADYAHAFGLGTPTHIVFPEKTGLVPSREWKEENKGERWWPGETLSASIGQSFLLVTPMQVARMISSIFTGDLVKPRIMTNEPIERTPLSIKPETLQFLQESMRSVVTRGTGKKISAVKDIEIYAKTSTAQTSTFYKRSLGKQYLEHGWFVAHFRYQENQRLTFVIIVENSGSSRAATSVAKNFLLGYKDLMDKREHKSVY